MKKVLFATTALVASAGIASAQGVTLSGSAEMGIRGGDGIETQFHTGVDVRFNLSGETDNGLTFGATVDLDDVGESAIRGNDIADTGASELADFSVFISGNFGTLTMGDTDGALDWAMTEVAIGGALADDHTAHGGYNGNSRADGNGARKQGEIARYDYSFGDFAFAVSAELDDSGVQDPTFQIGGKYSGDLGGVKLGVGLGYADYATDESFGISLDATFAGGFRAIVNYSDLGDSDGGGVAEDHFAVGFGYTRDALTIGVNYGMYTEGASEQDGYGLAVNYDLGGGAQVQFGYGSTQQCGVYAGCATGDTFSLGVAMSF